MTEAQMAAIAAIESQQPQKHNTVWMAGEQLKEIARSEPGSAELLAKDLAGKGMTIADAEKKIAELARKNRDGNCGCVSSEEAEDVLRAFAAGRGPGNRNFRIFFVTSRREKTTIINHIPMTITAADIKIGMCIEMDGKTFLVVDFQHCKPGKGPAFVRSKLKNLENGRVLENTFSSVSQKIEQVRVERRPYQFTYEDDLGAHFMHTETFEEINIDRNLINNYDLITDGQIVEVMFHTEKEAVLSAELPPIVDMEVIYTEPGIKGDTASTNSLKPATVNSATAKDGATIRVPLFINTGDKIRVDTRTREYYERIK